MSTLSRRDWLFTAGTAATGLMLPKTLLVAQEASKEFTLPKLPYATDALVPHIDAKTMEIHHGKHHAGYVANLNKALAGTDWVGKPIEEILANLGKAPKAIQAALRNNGGGHYNHTLFWQVMSAKGGKPSAELAAAIEKSFKGFDAMLAEFKTSAMTRFGSGWAWLVAGKEGKLGILSSANQDNPLMIGAGVPILGIDVWEHAYYLNYQNRRADYVDAFFKVINWDFVSARYQAAVKM